MRSIRSRLIVASTLLIVVIVSAIVAIWIDRERRTIVDAKIAEARALALANRESIGVYLVEGNWSQVTAAASSMVASDRDVIYVLVSEGASGGRIVSAWPIDQAGRIVPDLVPWPVSRATLERREPTQTTETVLLRDIEDRARAGDRLVEVSVDLGRNADGSSIGSLRIGVSLRAVEVATDSALQRAVLIAVGALLLGLVGSYLMARGFSAPVARLQIAAERIAAGDLAHKATVDGAAEIAALATAFNTMSTELDRSFQTLRGTVAAFERFVPQKFLHVIAPEGIDKIKVGTGAQRTMTILFTDIRGYTTLSETVAPAELFEQLNEYLSRVATPIGTHGGFIDKYIGDAIMALFDDPHTDGALDAALGMRAALAAYNTERVAAGLSPLESGIGLHRGDVVMGTVGFTAKIDSTVIGDPVNVASRVEGLTKTYHCGILVTDSVVAGLAHPERYQLRVVEESVKLRGKDTHVKLYEVQAR
jgi:class 3 adenylate cyclase